VPCYVVGNLKGREWRLFLIEKHLENVFQPYLENGYG